MKHFQSPCKDFAILKTKVNGKKLVYFDNAATSQKPKTVINSILNYYQNENANTHSDHFLASNLTKKVNASRCNIANFLKVKPQDIIFTKGATESLNLVANSYGRYNLTAGDEIIISQMEHHANFVPWITLAKELSLKVKIWKVREDGSLDLNDLKKLITTKSKLLAVCHISNVLGIINPISEIISIAKKNKLVSVVDGTQAIPHLDINLQELDPDFYAFSSHKMYGPTGVGVLYVNSKIVDTLQPYQTGGEMVEEVDLDKITFKKSPYLFEAGTLNFEGIIGFNEAINYLQKQKNLGAFAYEESLSNYLFSKLSALPEIVILGQNQSKIPLFSFYFKHVNSYDLASFLNLDGIAVRVGKHCAHPLLKAFSVDSTIRASLSFYNSKAEINYFIQMLEKNLEKLNQFSR